MGVWNYRIIRTLQNGEAHFNIHEVYYDVEGKGEHLWTENPISVGGETIEDLSKTLDYMKQALQRPILEIVDDKLQEWKPD